MTDTLKSQKVTIGRLVTIVVASVTIGSGAIALAKWSDIGRHEDKAISKAHPDASEKFVYKHELQKALRRIDSKFARLEAILTRIESYLKK